MPCCSVFKCSNTPGQEIDGRRISFHKFPSRDRSPVRHKAWVNKISRVGFVPSATSVVCSNHFSPAEFHASAQLKVDFGLFEKKCNPVLMKTAIPSINMKGCQGPVASSSSASEPPSKRRRDESVYLRRKTVADAMQNVGGNTLTDVQIVISEPDIHIYDDIADDREATRDIGIQCNLIGDDLVDNLTKACDEVDPGERLDSSYVPLLTIEEHTDDDDDVNEISDEEESGNESSEDNADNNRPNARDIYYDSFIVLWDCLKLLFVYCMKCGHKVTDLQQSTKGAALIVSTICIEGHRMIWRSQAANNRFGVGTVKLATSLYCTGMSFIKFHSFAAAINMLFFSEATYYRIVRRFIAPCIKHTWMEHRMNNIREVTVREGGAWLSGDGQYDSPGYCAKYCTYTIMDVKTDKIIDFIVLQKGLVAGELEKPACDKLLTRLIEKDGINIDLFLTDRHRGIRKMMREKYDGILHEFDVWHVSKSLAKAIKAVEKKAPTLEGWKPSIINHLWWSSMTCDANDDVLIEKFKSVLSHVTNTHSWEGNNHFHTCVHDNLDEEEERDVNWIDESSHDFRVLSNIILDKTFLHDLRHTKHYCHTGSLESYHNVRLKYLPKKSAFSYDGMVLRGMLAIIDHNENVGRVVRRTETRYSKITKKYVERVIREDKCYNWRKILIDKVLAFVRGDLDVSIEDDPHLVDVPQNIAPIPRPSLEEMQHSRFTRFHQY